MRRYDARDITEDHNRALRLLLSLKFGRSAYRRPQRAHLAAANILFAKPETHVTGDAIN
jgi:hypothetical protein